MPKSANTRRSGARAACTRLVLASAAALALALAQPRAVWAQAAESPAAAVSAAQRETARTWVLEGRQLFAAQDYAAALERFTAAYQLVRVPTVGIEVARAQEALGKWVEANMTAVEVINLPRTADEPQVFEQARQAARDSLRNLTPRIPALQLDITPADAAARVELDGEEMPLARGTMSFKLNPGVHQLRVHAPGYRAEQRTVSLAERERQSLPVALLPEPPHAPGSPSGAVQPLHPAAGDESGPAAAASGARTRGYVALGAAGVAALLGSVTGALAFSSKPDCPGNRCAADQRDEADRSRAYGNVATVSFGVAAAAAAYGAWELWLNAPRQGQRGAAPIAPRVGLVPLERGAALQASGEF